MDPTFLILLSNLLHLQNHLDPTTSPLTTTSSTTTTTTLLTTSSFTPLLIFTLSSLLSFLTTTTPTTTTTTPLSSFLTLSRDLPPPSRDSHWRHLYGLSYPLFTTIVDKLKPYIAQSNLSLPPDYAVAMVLSRLRHGLSSPRLARNHSLDPYLVSKITNMVTRLLSTKLYPEFVKIPAGRRRIHEITQGFEDFANLSNICGAIDSSPVRVKTLGGGGGGRDDGVDPNAFVCKHGYIAVNLQVVADHKKVFWDVCVKAPGGVDDATHFRDSVLYHRLISGDVVWDKVVNVRGHPVRPYLVGDWCYPLLSFLLTPFSGNGQGTPAQNSFDNALLKARSSATDAIALLKGRWKILQNLNVGLHHAPQTIVACCVLHNLCQIAREPEPELWNEPEECGPPPRVLESERSFYYYGENLRQTLADDLHQRLSSR